MRTGTENVLGIAGFGRAAELMSGWFSNRARVRSLRDSLEAALKGLVPGMKVNGHPVERLPNTLNAVLPGFGGSPWCSPSTAAECEFPPALPARAAPRGRLMRSWQ